MARLTEKEVAEIASEVGEVDWNDPIVKAWALGQLQQQEQMEKTLQGAFAIQKILRSDERMEQTRDQLRDVRRAIKVFKEVLGGGNK